VIEKRVHQKKKKGKTDLRVDKRKPYRAEKGMKVSTGGKKEKQVGGKKESRRNKKLNALYKGKGLPLGEFTRTCWVLG